MIIDNEQQLILIESLRCYRDKLVSMKINAKPVNDFLGDFRREKEKVEAEESNKSEADTIQPLTGKIIDGKKQE
jgi:hypothetical protein